MLGSDCIQVTQSKEVFTHEVFTEDSPNYWKIKPNGKVRVDVFMYSIFAGYQDFQTAIPNTNFTAEELRGLTYITEENSSFLTERYWGLGKFYNFNETIGCMYEDLQKLDYVGSAEKFDGSCITYVNLFGVWMPKTKRFFSGEAIDSCPEMTEEFSTFLQVAYENNLQPFFEIVSPNHKLVVSHEETRLKLIWYRDLNTGEYIFPEDGNVKAGWALAHVPFIDTVYYVKTKEFIDEVTETQMMKNAEGKVHVFRDPKTQALKLVKQKSLWYYSMLGLSKKELRVSDVLGIWLTGHQDDVSALFFEQPEKKEFVDQFTEKMRNYYDVWEERIYNWFELCATTKELSAFVKKTPGSKIHSKLIFDTFKGNSRRFELKEGLRRDLVRVAESTKRAKEWWSSL